MQCNHCIPQGYFKLKGENICMSFLHLKEPRNMQNIYTLQKLILSVLAKRFPSLKFCARHSVKKVNLNNCQSGCVLPHTHF